MLTEVIMPKLGLTMEEGAVRQWHKPEGAQVEQGEPLVDIETDKTVIEVEAPASGFLRSIMVAADTSGVPVGQPLALITTTADEAMQHGAALGAAPQAPSAAPAPVAPGQAASFATPGDAPLAPRASPAARRAARELQVDLATVTGTAPGGLISVEDVEKAAAASAAESPTAAAPATNGQAVPLNNMRRAIARAMVLSHRSAPVFVLRRKARVNRMLEAYRARKAQFRDASGLELTVTDVLLHAAAATLRRHPTVNASFVGDPQDAAAHIVQHAAIHIGLAVATDDGLVVPVIRNAGDLGLAELARRRQDLVARARAGRLKADELSGGTFSISNLGGLGVDSFTAMVNPPEAAILAVGRTIEEPVVEAGALAVSSTMNLSLTADHRVIDGAQGARFLVDLVATLEQASVE